MLHYLTYLCDLIDVLGRVRLLLKVAEENHGSGTLKITIGIGLGRTDTRLTSSLRDFRECSLQSSRKQVLNESDVVTHSGPKFEVNRRLVDCFFYRENVVICNRRCKEKASLSRRLSADVKNRHSVHNGCIDCNGCSFFFPWFTGTS